jgi:hyperosmotically inducible periplasmic protein
MQRSIWITLAAASMFGLAALLAVGVTRSYAQDAPKPTFTEKIKDTAASAATSIKKGAISAEEAVKEKFSQAKAGVVKMGIEARVYGRLHWDKGMVDSKIELHSPSPGVIVLTGTASSEKAKAKAAELTADTVGVTQVTNTLVVSAAAPATEPAKP